MAPRRIALIVTIAVAALPLAGCTPGTATISGSSVSVAIDSPFYSYNAQTAYGRSPANSDIVYATNSGFNYYDNTLSLVRDESFGHYEKLSDDPLTVRYTVADGTTWSDGAPVDAADLLLAWAAASGVYDTRGFTPAPYTDPTTGQFTTAFPEDVVYFDSGTRTDPPTGLGLVTQVPQISADRKSMTLVYDTPYVDWESAFFAATSPGLPAHVVAAHALGITDDDAAKDAVIAAVQGGDRKTLAALSQFWNSGFNLGDLPKDPDLLVGSGPYTISDFVAGEHVTLTANRNYTGDRRPRFETIRVRFIPDPLTAVQALNSGEVQVISPQPSAEVVDALARLGGAGVVVVEGDAPGFERLDLRFGASKNGVFADGRVREAFLKTIPRQQIVDTLVAPVKKSATTRDSQLFLPGSPGYAASVSSNASKGYEQVDLSGAVALLADAGMPNPAVCLRYDSTNPQRVQEFELIQRSASLAGFAVGDCGSTDAAASGAPGASGDYSEYDAVLSAWQSPGPGVVTDTTAYRTDGANNVTGYSNPRVDSLLDRLDATLDQPKRMAILQQLDTALWNDSYGVPLFQFPALAAFDRAEVTGIAPSTLIPGVFWNVWRWSPAR